jgi:hypothetical protein
VRKIRLCLAQSLAFLIRPLGFCDVNVGADEFDEIAGGTENGMAYCVDFPDLAPGMNDPVIEFELHLSRLAFSNCSMVLARSSA